MSPVAAAAPLLRRLLAGSPAATAVADVYRAIVAQARRPEFYADCGVPDTLDGRFDMIALHAFLVLHRLKGEGAVADRFAQRLFDLMFADMDRGLRELGVGDLAVSKRVKAMGKAFYGRAVAYQEGLAQADDGPLRAALDRNLFGTLDEPDPRLVARMAVYVRREAAALAADGVAAILAGVARFGPPPAPAS